MTATIHGMPRQGPTDIRIAEDTRLTGILLGNVTMKHDVHLEITAHAAVQGSVSTEHDATLVVRGTLQGSLQIAPDSSVIVYGTVQGEIVVGDRSTLDIRPGGKVAGPVINRGLISNSGARSGAVVGNPPQDAPGSRVVRPTIVNGDTTYNL